MKDAILSFEMLEKLYPGKFVYPMSTADVLRQLAYRGICISSPNVERLIRIHEIGVPTIGRTRAWGNPQVDSLIDHIIRDANEPANQMTSEFGPAHVQLPSWMKACAAGFYGFGISADEWVEKRLAFEAAHKVTMKGCGVTTPWYAIPYGAKLVMHADISGEISFDFELDESIAGSKEPTPPAPAKKAPATKAAAKPVKKAKK
jgi:hypothetical protein